MRKENSKLLLLGISTVIAMGFSSAAYAQNIIGLGGGVTVRSLAVGGTNLSFISFKLIGEASPAPAIGLYGSLEYIPLISWGGSSINASIFSFAVLYQIPLDKVKGQVGVGIGLIDLEGLFSSLTLNALVGGSINLAGNLFAYVQLEAVSLIGRVGVEVGLPLGIGLGIILYM